MKDIGEIVIYGAPWCGDCVRSEALLDSLNILYKKVDIDKQREVEQYIKEKQNGLRKIPHIVFEDESFLVEPSDEELMNKIQELISKTESRNWRWKFWFVTKLTQKF